MYQNQVHSLKDSNVGRSELVQTLKHKSSFTYYYSVTPFPLPSHSPNSLVSGSYISEFCCLQ